MRVAVSPPHGVSCVAHRSIFDFPDVPISPDGWFNASAAESANVAVLVHAGRCGVFETI